MKPKLKKYLKPIGECLQVSEVGLTYHRKTKAKVFISCCVDAENIFKSVWELDKIELKEQMYAAFLSRSNEVLATSFISEGSATGTVIPIQNILQTALLLNTSSLIIAHNHPSGNLKPSMQDIEVSRKLKDACSLLDICLVDSLILTADGCYSMAENDNLR